jgi:hypothetical protein
MSAGSLTDKEKEVIRNILMEHDITHYEIFPEAPEGSLPQGTYPHEVFAMSGLIITINRIYSFWLDWEKDHYTLGHGTHFWEEVQEDELKTLPKAVFEIQQELRESMNI